jgi:hypothetical protein
VLVYTANHEAKTVIWVAREITDEHRKTLDWLNDSTPPDFSFFGIEIELWRIGDSPPAPRFNVISEPNQLTKIEKSRNASNELTDLRIAQLEFWADLKRLGEEKGSTLRFRKPLPQQWQNMAIGRTGFALGMSVVARDEGEVRCGLLVDNFDGEHLAFDAFAEDKAEIEKEVGELEWRRLPGKYSEIRRSHPGSILNQSERPQLLSWLLESAEAFHACFADRVASLEV